MSRDCKPLADEFDFADLPRRVLIPAGVTDASLRTDVELRDLLAFVELLTELPDVRPLEKRLAQRAPQVVINVLRRD